jgi:hypothetical protein
MRRKILDSLLDETRNLCSGKFIQGCQGKEITKIRVRFDAIPKRKPL